MENKKLVLIGDIVSSRKISERISFDKKLLQTLDELNQRNSLIISPYTLTIGDEIQAVFEDAESVFHDAISILSAIYPQKMRFSLGVGAIIKPINTEQAIGMDGPAFHFARDGIDAMKKSGYLFQLSGENIPHFSLHQHALFLISHNIARWNKTRLLVLEMLLNKLPVKSIAANLHISEQAVYKTINTGALEIIISLFTEIETTLSRCLKGQA